MDIATRRKFLIASGVVGASALATGITAYSLQDVIATATDDIFQSDAEDVGLSAASLPGDARTLVLVTLYGGNDGLNTVIPYADKAYYDARPGLSWKAEEVLKIDAETGLNPGLKGLHQLYTDKKLAIIRGVGYPMPDRSHFRSMDIWHTANPVRPGTTGWIGRWLDALNGDPRMAVSFEQVLPPLLAGATSSGAVVGGNGLKLPRGVKIDTLAGLGQATEGESKLQARAAGCFADLVRVDQMMKGVAETTEFLVPDDESPRSTGTGGSPALNSQLDLVAQCVEAGAATRVFSVSLGGFDNHADEKNPHRGLLGLMDKSISNFLARIAKSAPTNKVVVVVYSEFGRRVKANASDGTDHGTASNVFVMGHGVKGGIYGEQPSLTKLDQGDLKYTTDFRDVYATLLEQTLQSDPERCLEGWKGRLTGVF